MQKISMIFLLCFIYSCMLYNFVDVFVLFLCLFSAWNSGSARENRVSTFTDAELEARLARRREEREERLARMYVHDISVKYLNFAF